MDEITLTRELGRETPMPSPARLATARALLVAELPPPRSRRRRWPALMAAAAAAAIAAVTIPHTVSQTAQPAPPPAPQPSAPRLVPVAAFLNEAAAVADRAPDTVPRDDQYVHVKSKATDGTTIALWRSVDGEHDGEARGPNGREVFRACKNGKTLADNEDGTTSRVGCEPQPAYFPDMPTDPAAMVSWLKKRSPAGNGAGFDINGVGKEIGALSWEVWLRPAQRAALYRAAGMIKGIQLVENVKSADGRSGTGVAWNSSGSAKPEVFWVFDSKTHVLLGGGNTVLVTQPTLVDRVGQTG